MIARLALCTATKNAPGTTGGVNQNRNGAAGRKGLALILLFKANKNAVIPPAFTRFQVDVQALDQ